MARYPVPGRVKTRLAKTIGDALEVGDFSFGVVLVVDFHAGEPRAFKALQ
jgi:hypothetical protein